jgi:hypothetical protein
MMEQLQFTSWYLQRSIGIELPLQTTPSALDKVEFESSN